MLDVGCRDGALSYLLARKGFLVSGIDNQEIAIRFAIGKTKGLNINFKVGSAYKIPWRDGTFDAVVPSDVIEHLQDTKRLIYRIENVQKNNQQRNFILFKNIVPYMEKNK